MWLKLTTERVLNVDRGRELILCDRHASREILVRLSPEAIADLRRQLDRPT